MAEMGKIIYHFCGLLSLQLITVSYAVNTDLMRDYFAYKNITRVAGFSCGEIPEHLEIIRALNDAGIMVSLKQLKPTTDIAKFLHTQYWNLGVFLNLECPYADVHVMEIFREATAHYMFDHLHQWLIMAEDMNRTIELINDRWFSIITDMTIAVPSNYAYVLYDVYNHCKPCGGLLNITTLGNWTKEDGLNISLRSNKFSRRWNYHGMKVKIAGVLAARPRDQDLMEYLQEANSVRTDNWSKFGYSIITHVAELFNFTLDVIELSHWARNDSNGPLMGGLKQGTFDLGYFPSILTVERLNLAEVIVQVWPVRTCFMFITVPSFKADMSIIFRPFARTVWYTVLLLAIIIILALWAILKVEKDVVDAGYGTTILIMIAALCQQGLPFFGNQIASRVTFLQVMIFGLLVYNCYSAAIVSSRLNTPLDKMNDSLYSLLRSRMKLAAHKDIYFNILLRSPAEEVQYFKRFWDTIPDEKKFCPIEEGIRRITKPGFAYHADPINAYPHVERIFDKQMICQLTEVHLLRPASLGLWSARHSQFREISKIGLIKIATSGLRKREALRWSYRKPYCNKDKHYVSSVTIYETIPIMLVLLCGMILAGIICCLEHMHFHLVQLKQGIMKKAIQQQAKR